MNNRHRLAVLSTVITMFSCMPTISKASGSTSPETRWQKLVSPFDLEVNRINLEEKKINKSFDGGSGTDAGASSASIAGDDLACFGLDDHNISGACSDVDPSETGEAGAGSYEAEEEPLHIDTSYAYDETASRQLLGILRYSLEYVVTDKQLMHNISTLLNYNGANPLAIEPSGISTLHLLVMHKWLSADVFYEIFYNLIEAADSNTRTAINKINTLMTKTIKTLPKHKQFDAVILESPYSMARHNSKFVAGYQKAKAALLLAADTNDY